MKAFRWKPPSPAAACIAPSSGLEVKWQVKPRSALGARFYSASRWLLWRWISPLPFLDGRAGSGLRGGAYRAVASQLSPRRTWRHLVPVTTVLTDATAGGCGLQGSAPEPVEEAADAKEQEVCGGAVPK